MRRFIPLLVVALLVAMVLPAAVAAKKPATAPVPIAFSGVTAADEIVRGTFTITRFAVQNGQVVALGEISNVTLAGVAAPGTQVVALPVLAAVCPILHLELGPLDLNLLGLVIHLDRVVLDISAVPGAGNLLGNLLCAVAGLLDGGGPLTVIAMLLNRILAILGGLTL